MRPQRHKKQRLAAGLLQKASLRDAIDEPSKA